MFIFERDGGCRCTRRRVGVRAALAAGVAFVFLAGCSHHNPALEPGYSDQGKTQIQFYSPPGASVTVKDCQPRVHQVGQYGPYGQRLEYTPEEFSVFNLSPGTYEFKYTAAEGLGPVSVYGELQVEHANAEFARLFQRRAFVPISLPSEHYRRVEVIGPEIYPYRGEAFRTAIDENDILRLRQGDVVEKVFFVADLKLVEHEIRETEQDVAVYERKLEYAEARFRNAYLDFRVDVTDKMANFWRTDRKFIAWQEERVELAQKLERLERKLTRLRTLLSGDTVLVRRGMLVLATEEVIEPYDDPEETSDELGEVLVVMRLGGRHMHWGEPGRELAGYSEPMP
ncbi:MAG: hypothetical protein AMXMBFR13_07990 [Phycisphaerae bacterium]